MRQSVLLDPEDGGATEAIALVLTALEKAFHFSLLLVSENRALLEGY
jgi:hypothetical protein